MARRIARDPNAISVNDLPNLITEYRNADAMAKQISERAGKMKERMKKLLDSKESYTDDKGNKWIDVKMPGVKTGIKHELRVSESYNRERIEEWLRKNKLWSECSKTVEVLDDDAFWALVFDDKISEAQLEQFKDRSESWAFRIV